jgi:hypothetical protein
MKQTQPETLGHSGSSKASELILDSWGVRYQVEDVGRSVDFYTSRLGFKLDHQNPPAFAQVSTGKLKLILSGPEHQARGRCRMADANHQADGIGWSSRSRTFRRPSRP